MASTEQMYRYRSASTATVHGERADVVLATSGGPEPNPHFFTGFVGNAAQNAKALLVVAEVARTRFYEPPGMVAARLAAADPVVTSNPGTMRFEAFSACCGVYARLDLHGSSLAAEDVRFGTTNVDFNPPMRSVLGQVGDGEPMHLQVGHDEVSIRTIDGGAVEKKVPLPDRWVKGFGEVQLVSSRLVLQQEIGAVEARRFLQSIRPGRAQRGTSWAVPAGRGLRVSRVASAGAVCLPGPERVRLLLKLAPHVRAVRAYAPLPDDSMEQRARSAIDRPAAPSAWEVVLDDARLVMVLSPDVTRGFSGEGAVLDSLASADDALSTRLAAALDGTTDVDATVLARTMDVDRAAVERELGRLSAAGWLGFDLADGTFFQRQLPFASEALERLHPRLLDARRLVDDGAVTIDGDADAHVRSEDVTHRVGVGPTGAATCTCPWYGRHKGDRGPCKHVLAVALVRQHLASTT